ncbi:putative ribonuclease H-like domain-containing protein [Tanacetum coccineum]
MRLKAKLEQFETSSKNLNKLINSQISSKDNTGLGYEDQLNENDSSVQKDIGYHAVPPPLTGNYMPPLADLSFAGLNNSVYRPTANKTSARKNTGQREIIPVWNSVQRINHQNKFVPSAVLTSDVPRHMTMETKTFLTEYQDIEEVLFALVNTRGGQGPNWLFNIDSLTNSMNYRPVTAGNQTNKNAVHKKLMVIQSSDEKYKNDTADDVADETPVQKPAIRKEFKAQCNRELLQGKATRANNTNNFNTVSTPFNAASTPRTSNDDGPSFVPLGSFPLDANDFLDDPIMPDLEDTAAVQNTGIFGSAYDDDDDDLDTYNSPYADQVVGVEADFNNMEPSTVASPIPTTRIHSIHPKNQIIRDPKSAVEAMQEELLQFKIQKVWTLVDLSYGKKAIGIKWVYRNKKDKRGIVVKNIAGLITRIQTEEGIEYDKVFAPVARIEAIKGICFMPPPVLWIQNFQKSLYVKKALYGLHQAPRAWYESLSGKMSFVWGPLSLSFDFVFSSEIFKSLSFRLDRLCHLAILCLDQHAHTLHHLESLLTISLDRLDIFEGRSCISEFVRKSLSLILELS